MKIVTKKRAIKKLAGRKSFRELLLEGPVMTTKQLTAFLSNRKRMSEWRKK
jgi:hypothetical protein